MMALNEPIKIHQESEACIVCIQEEPIRELTQTTTQISTTLKALSEEITSISRMINGGSIMVEIKNGDGLLATMKLNDLLQSIYDRPKRTVTKWETTLTSITVISKSIFWIVGIFYIVMQLLSSNIIAMHGITKP